MPTFQHSTRGVFTWSKVRFLLPLFIFVFNTAPDELHRIIERAANLHQPAVFILIVDLDDTKHPLNWSFLVSYCPLSLLALELDRRIDIAPKVLREQFDLFLVEH